MDDFSSNWLAIVLTSFCNLENRLFRTKDRQLKIQHQQVETLGLLVFGIELCGQAGDLFAEVEQIRLRELFPRLCFRESFD